MSGFLASSRTPHQDADSRYKLAKCAGFFGGDPEEVPSHALTVGWARHGCPRVSSMVSGIEMARALRHAVEMASAHVETQMPAVASQKVILVFFARRRQDELCVGARCVLQGTRGAPLTNWIEREALGIRFLCIFLQCMCARGHSYMVRNRLPPLPRGIEVDTLRRRSVR
jgi:hypothetical protein